MMVERIPLAFVQVFHTGPHAFTATVASVGERTWRLDPPVKLKPDTLCSCLMYEDGTASIVTGRHVPEPGAYRMRVLVGAVPAAEAPFLEQGETPAIVMGARP